MTSYAFGSAPPPGDTGGTPWWSGQTDFQREHIADLAPRFVEQMMASQAAGTLPSSGQIEAARQDTVNTLGGDYTPQSYAPAPQQGGGPMPGWLSGLLGGGGMGIPMPRFNNRGNDAVNMDDPFNQPMGANSIGGYSTRDHQQIARQAGYGGEFGGGLFEAAMVADPSLRERFNSGVNQFSQNAMAPMGQYGGPMDYNPSTPFGTVGQYGGGGMPGGTWVSGGQMYGQQPYGQSYGMSDPFGFGAIDFGYGGQQPYGGTMGYGQQQGALSPFGGYDQSRGAFQFARGGRVR